MAYYTAERKDVDSQRDGGGEGRQVPVGGLHQSRDELQFTMTEGRESDNLPRSAWPIGF